ncbi:MAG TPA: glycosyltransferase family 4 protein [Gallionellaceae bacterium]|nr:glycosyltransferase family 4 protein [Gallionellaceae bacterium]
MPKQSVALIYASLPPPVGGIASIVAMLHQNLAERSDVFFVSPMAKDAKVFAKIYRPLLNLVKLAIAIARVRKDGRILFFSSAGNSFFEKILWALLVIVMGRKPIVVMVDGNFPSFWDKCHPILKKVSAQILCNPQLVLGAQSEGWQNYYRSIFPSAGIKIVGATVAPEFFEHTRAENSALRKLTIVYVGWIIEEKGIIDLLDAMAILRATHPEARLRIVGPLFGKEDYWKRASSDRGVSAQVEYVGSVSDRQRLMREFDAASIFVFPSHFEGFPVALLEAITMGLACVGTSVGGIPDILDHGKAGIVVAPKAPIELANALKTLLDDHGLVEILSKQAAMRARTAYSHSACIEFYKNLLGLK